MGARRAAADGVTPEDIPGTPARVRRRGVPPVAVVGFVALAGLLVAVGLVAWQVFGTTWLARDAAADTVTQLRAEWAAATPSPSPATSGGPVAEPEIPLPVRPAPREAAWILRIPALGIETPIFAGVEPEELRRGVGWYPTTALPGQVGNTAIAGLRLTHGEPFARLLELRVGDEVAVDTAEATFTYRIVLAPADLTVQADESWVLDPVPGEPDTVPSQAILTLTTHEDLIDSPDRSVGFGVLEKAETTR